MDNIELIDTVSKAMRTAWKLGQTYWRQADSDFTSDHRRSDETQRKYDMLVQETIAVLSRSQDAPRCQCCGYLVTESEHRGCLRAAERSQDVARVAEPDFSAFDWLETEITAVDCWYRGDPSYEHDAYWMKDKALKLIGEARKIFAAPQPPQAGANTDAVELLRKFMEYRDSDYVPNVLFDLARTIIDCAPAPAEPLQRLAEAQRPLPADMAKVLHDNLPDLYLTDAPAEPKGEQQDAREQAIAALVNLGLTRKEAEARTQPEKPEQPAARNGEDGYVCPAGKAQSQAEQRAATLSDEQREVLFGNFGALLTGENLCRSTGNDSDADGLKALAHALSALLAAHNGGENA